MVSQAPDVVRMLLNGAATVVVVTKRSLVGNVSTQSVFELVPASRMYSLITSECIIVAVAALVPAETVSVPTVVALHEEK